MVIKLDDKKIFSMTKNFCDANDDVRSVCFVGNLLISAQH